MTRIPIVFCFDQNLISQIQVTVASLLDNRKDAHYSVYCVCVGDAYKVEERLTDVMHRRDAESTLTIVRAENAYKDSYQRGSITAGTYLRLTLPETLVDLEKVIYTDIDVMFCDSLQQMWDIELGDNMLGAVKGAVNFEDQWELNSKRDYWSKLADMKGRYINAGVTIMNLEKMRENHIQSFWQNYSKEKFHYQDQDILNMTCRDSIVYLPPRYNVQAYMYGNEYERFVLYGIFTEKEVTDAQSNPAILHFAADKPWKRYDLYRNDIWWDYVNSQDDLKGLFDEEAAKRYHGPGIVKRGIRKIRRCLGTEI